MQYPHRLFECCIKEGRPLRLMVRTSPFHGGNRGSNPLGDASKSPKHYSYASECNAAVFYDRKFFKNLSS